MNIFDHHSQQSSFRLRKLEYPACFRSRQTRTVASRLPARTLHDPGGFGALAAVLSMLDKPCPKDLVPLTGETNAAVQAGKDVRS